MVMSIEQYIWMNGKFIPWDQANIHVMTHSLHYSGAVFEGERSYNGKVFKLPEHTQRLFDSAKLLGMEPDYSIQDVESATYELLKRNNLSDAYIRPLIWRGDGGINLNAECKVNILILAKESSPVMKNNLNIVLSKWKKVSPDAMPSQCKSSAHYMMARITKNQALTDGYDDALLLDSLGFVAESTTSNVFFVSGDILITPIADRFLNGITRQTILDIAKKLGIKTEERRIALDDIKNYDGCFLTGTAAEVKGVSSISLDKEKLEFSNQKILSIMQSEYKKLVRV
ncbi:MAG TPA: branched-chain amino acid transaminase [Candidatus Megaira endosymbiont of Nemacystus decipiens]|nr:branched-chain amino acid transaminase [Candidatus Megaera endosymbiont of Nemacystus decipiens]